jgi:autotransporter-associated beta strand protein
MKYVFFKTLMSQPILKGYYEMPAKSSCIVFLSVLCALVTATAEGTDLSVLKQNYVNQQYGLFLHYNMGTYTNEEWAHSGVAVNTFNPTGNITAATAQWAATAVAAGMKYGVLTAKHHDGFALWDTDQSTYDIASTSWYNNSSGSNYHVDIVQSYVNAFRSAGLGVGLYYSFWDKYNGVGITPYYSDDITLGQKSSAAATAYVEAEINHLLTAYGHIDVLWVDGWGWANTSQGVSYSTVNYQTVYNYIKQVSPDTLLVNNVNEGTTAHTDIIDYETQFSGQIPPVGNTTPSEGNATLRSNNGWFYTGSPASSVGYKPASFAGASILTMNSRNATYLLDVPPDTTGFLPTAAVSRLADVRTYLANTPGIRAGNLAYGKTATESSNWGNTYPASNAANTSRTDFAHTDTSDTSPWWKVDLGSMMSIGEIELFNRADGYDGRLRDITVQILAADGTTVLYTSPLLNPQNILGGGQSDYANGPSRLCLFVNDGTPVTGRYIRVSRTIETSGAGNTDDRRCLTLSDVEAYAFRTSNIKWMGAVNGVWDVNTTANWFNTAALIADKYHVSPTADAVSFSDLYENVYSNALAPSTTTVTLNATVSPSAVVFNANTLNYSLSGSGGISGGTSVVKSGSGTVTVSTSNSYTGGTVINGGTFSIGSDAALGASTGSLTINQTGTASAVLQISAGLTLANNRSLAIGSGGGAIEVAGSSNTLTIAPLSSTAVTINGPLALQGGGMVNLVMANSPTLTSSASLAIAGGTTPTTLNAGGSADPFSSGSIHMDVVNNGNLNITSGSKQVGNLSGTGSTSLAASTQLTATSVTQGILTLGTGATLTIAAVPGGPNAGDGTTLPVPEPSTWAMLMLAIIGLTVFRHTRRMPRRTYGSH